MGMGLVHEAMLLRTTYASAVPTIPSFRSAGNPHSLLYGSTLVWLNSVLQDGS